MLLPELLLSAKTSFRELPESTWLFDNKYPSSSRQGHPRKCQNFPQFAGG